MAPTPGIEPGPTGWQLETIPRRHSDIYLKRPKLKLFKKKRFYSINKKEKIVASAIKQKSGNKAWWQNLVDNKNYQGIKKKFVTKTYGRKSCYNFQGIRRFFQRPMKPTPGIEPGPAGWQLKTIPRRHSDIYLERPELQIFITNRCHLQRNEKIDNAHN